MDAKLVTEYGLQQLKTFAVCPTHFSYCDNTNIILRSLFFSSFQKESEVLLRGHHALISALTFGKSPQEERILVSAASDYIITWNVVEVTECQQNDKDVRGHIFSSTVESPHSLVYSYNYCLLGAISEHYLIIYDINTKEVLFEKKVKDLSCLQFINQKEILTTSFNGVVTLWHLEDEEILWQNTSSLGFSLTSLAVCPIHNRFSVGSSIVVVREYVFCNGAQLYKQYQKIDLDENLKRISHQWKQTANGDESRGHVLAMMYYNQTRGENLELLNDTCHLLCATERALFCINCHTQEVNACSYFEDDIGAPFVSEAQFTTSKISGEIFCAVVCLFEPKACVLSINLHQANSTSSISLVSNVPLMKSSVLQSSIKLSKPSKPKMDKPLTFKNKVKSSGYASSPRMTMFKPLTNVSKPSSTTKSAKPATSSESLLPLPVKYDWSAQVAVTKSLVLCTDLAAVKCISVNDHNRYLACGLSNSTVHVTPLPLPSDSDRCKLITGHNRSIVGCCWSHENDRLMTYTSNGQVKLWGSPFTKDALLTFEVKHSGKTLKDLVHGQFYYLDKFILLGLGNSMYMYKYAVQDCVKDDVKRYLHQSHCKLVGEWPMLSAQSVTCLTASNNMFSYIVLMGGSDRSIEVHDMNIGKQVHRFENAHSRALCAIHHCSGSSFVNEGLSDVFITSAVSDGIKLWDLRTQLCARKYNYHSCATKCRCVISSCGNYIATTTDNKSVCIYDVRHQFPLHDITGKHNAIALTFSSASNQILLGYDDSRLGLLEPM